MDHQTALPGLYNDLRGSQRLANRRPVPTAADLVNLARLGGVDIPTAATAAHDILRTLGQPR